ncbi:MAG: hypothetical protein JXA21_23710 [Anaerolineae bacterium]|nr:hypothetical protein [Anaerolineae bacterium]
MLLLPILVWYLVLQFFALAGLPLALAWMRHLPSRGYAVAKALGLLLTGVLFWWGCILHLWANTVAATLTAAGLIFALGVWLMHGQWRDLRLWWTERRAFVITAEVIFFVALVFWAFVRATQPHIQTAGGEKWMEIAYLNAILRAPFMPPHDPWLSGYAISYYYLGYVLLSLVTRLSAIPSASAFTLGCAGWYALAAIGAYGVVYDLLGATTRRAPSLDTQPRNHTFLPLFGPLLLLLAGNGEGFLEVLHARGLFSNGWWAWLDIRHLKEPPQAPFSWVPQRFFWWWQASRTIQDYTPWGDAQEVIDEFPAFSFILGDMHPHVLALPFALLLIALALNLYRQGLQLRSSWWSDWPARFLPLGGYAVVLGTLGFLNTWDLPIYWALFVGAMLLGARTVGKSTSTPLFARLWALLPEAGVLGVLSIVLYFPFWYALRSQAGGIMPNLFNATRLPQFLVMFTPLLIPVAGVVFSSAYRAEVRARSLLSWVGLILLGIIAAALLVGSTTIYPYLVAVLRGESVAGLSLSLDQVGVAVRARLLSPWVSLILATGVGAAVLSLMHTCSVSSGDDDVSSTGSSASAFEDDLRTEISFPLLLVLLGLLLTLAPEFVFLKDNFVTRMNTVFKFYFQAWVFWSLAGAWQLARWLDIVELDTYERVRNVFSPLWRVIAACVSFVLIVVGLVYTVLAIPARAKEHGVPWTFDGSTQVDSADLAAIHWLNANVAGTPVIVEAPGNAHKSYAYEARVSAFTGLPTVLGWAGHELQWRGNYDEQGRREQDLERLFTTTDVQEAQEILDRYNVSYIYIGPLELQRYPFEGLNKFATMFSAVYAANGVIIYHVEP